MPLLDHFHSPLAPRRHWESFHVNWAGAIADALNETLLPEGYFAEEHAQLGPRVEIDLATFTDSKPTGRQVGSTTTLAPRVWVPPAPAMVVPTAFPDTFEVLVFESESGARLVAAIELVSPGNKDRDVAAPGIRDQMRQLCLPGNRPHCDRHRDQSCANLHNQIMQLLGHEEACAMPAEAVLYGIAYRPIVRDGQEQIEIWPSALQVGQPLPVLPLALNAEIALPIDLEATYTAACQRRRLS